MIIIFDERLKLKIPFSPQASIMRKLLTFMLLSAMFIVEGCEGESPSHNPRPSVPRLASMIKVDAAATRQRLVEEEDIDGDRKITVDDRQAGVSERGDKKFVVVDTEGGRYEVSGNYQLSNLLQELSLACDRGLSISVIDPARVYENPVDRVSRLIREVYWDNLTRAVDEDHMPGILEDEKTETADGMNYIYVPHDDGTAWEYFNDVATRHPEWKIKVVRLPEKITPEYVRDLDGRHGVLSLKLIEENGKIRGVPFVVPGGRFNEMYGWDSYFIVLGLLADGKVELARDMVDNHVYQIEHYGRILNANRTYYLTRSQPPFLTSMALAVYDRMPQNDESRKWLAGVMKAAVKEYETIWMSPPHLTEPGLSRYYGEGIGPCPEVEPGHYDAILNPYAKKLGLKPDQYLEDYKKGKIREPELDRFFVHDRAVRESGHDTTYRFDKRTADFLTVDLNSLLYKYEQDFGRALDIISSDGLEVPEELVATGAEWRERSVSRKGAMVRLMKQKTKSSLCPQATEYVWFDDYDLKNERMSGYKSPTGIYPYWAGMFSKSEIEFKECFLADLEQAGGLAASSESSRGPVTEERPQRQWDYPYGWAPHQMLAWEGMRKIGRGDIADRLTYKWLYMIVRNAADYNGTIPEKFDVVNRSHQVFAEYGNVGTKFKYITKEGFGWMNASFQVGLKSLSPELVEKLKELVPPEGIFGPEADP